MYRLTYVEVYYEGDHPAHETTIWPRRGTIDNPDSYSRYFYTIAQAYAEYVRQVKQNMHYDRLVTQVRATIVIQYV